MIPGRGQVLWLCDLLILTFFFFFCALSAEHYTNRLFSLEPFSLTERNVVIPAQACPVNCNTHTPTWMVRPVQSLLRLWGQISEMNKCMTWASIEMHDVNSKCYVSLHSIELPLDESQAVQMFHQGPSYSWLLPTDLIEMDTWQLNFAHQVAF